MNLHETEIMQIIQTIWSSVLSLQCERSVEPPAVAPGSVAACVQITGAWKGAVVLACSEGFASKAAAIMFSMPDENATLTDKQDAVAELSNMIGGNLKGLLSGGEGCQLSLPAVVAGADYNARVPGSRVMQSIGLRSAGHDITVAILEKVPAANAA